MYNANNIRALRKVVKEMKKDETIKQVENIYKSKHRDWVNKIIIIKNNKVIKVYNRNN